MTTSAHPPAAPSGGRPARSFVLWLVVLSLGVTTCLAAVNWWLDPIGVTGRNTRFTSTQNGVVRTAKLDLMDRLPKPPDVLLLGSSRSMKLDPIDVEEIAGRTAFNAGVSGARTKDSFLFAAYADQIWPKQFPHIVIGVTNDMFHRTDSKGLDARLAPLVPDKLASGDGGSAYEMLTQLASLSTTKASIRTARIVVRAQGADTLLHPEGSTGIDALRGPSDDVGREASLKRGMQVFDPGTTQFNEQPTELRVELQMAEFIRSAFKGDPNYTGVDSQGLESFRALIQLANDHGDTPAVWITPYHPIAREMLPAEYEDRDRRFRDALEVLRDEDGLEFTLLDYEDPAAFDGDDDQWFDGIHMQEPNTRRVIEQLHRDGGL